MRSFLTSVAAAVCLAGALAITGPAAHAATTDIPACTGTVTILSLTFDPPQVTPGQSVTVTAIAQNCTNRPQQVSTGFFSRFVGPNPTSGIPAGCPAIDPLPSQQLTVAGGATFGWRLTYPVRVGCTATGLEVKARIWDSAGTDLAAANATVKITQPTPTAPCSVSYRTMSEWSGGFTVTFTITNTGTAPINGWTLRFSFPSDQHITQSWMASVQQNGAAVTAVNLPFNGSIAVGASVLFGILATWQTGNPAPTAFTLNNTACTSV